MKPVVKLLSVLLSLTFAGGAFALLAAAAAYMFVAESLPDVDTLKSVQLEAPMRVYSRDGLLIGEFGEKRRIPVSYEQLPQQVIDAFVAAEDDRFFEHPGVDYQGLARAVLVLARTGRGSQGGSTITMQVARNYLLTLRHSYVRKVREIFIALNMERVLSKQEILTLYLNKIFFGQRAYGVAAAAEVYFGKQLHELRLDEIAILAGIPKAPSDLNPVSNPDRSRSRRDYVLRRMRELGYIGAQAHELALAQPISASIHGPRVEGEAAYLAELARAEMVERYGERVYGSGLRVVTTLDSERQEAAVAAVRDALLQYDRRHGYRGPVDLRDLEEVGRTPEQLDAMLGEYPDLPLHELAVVTDVDEARALVHVIARSPGQVPLDGVKWARDYIDESRAGGTPARVGDVLAVGQVIYVQPMEAADAGQATQADSPTPDDPGLAPVPVLWKLGQAPAVQGALVSLDPRDGAVSAMVGGYDFRLSKFNRVSQAKRQPGSSFKPFVYSAALENGFTAASVLPDAPVVYDDPGMEEAWRPENYEREFRGPMRLREALVASRNLVSIRLLREVGIRQAIAHIGEFGFDPKELPASLSLALGSASLTPLQVATGYAVLANGGFAVSPYLVDRVESANGEVLFEATPRIACLPCERALELGALDAADGASAAADADRGVVARLASLDSDVATATTSASDMLPAEWPSADVACSRVEGFTGGYPIASMAPRVVSPQNVYIITDMMRDVVRRGTGRAAYRRLQRNDLAGKTGTTNEQRDAWFSGFNADLTATVWVGFDEFTRLGRGEVGGRAALPAWTDYMESVLTGRAEHSLSEPYGLVRVKIRPDTGELARAGESGWVQEIFRQGNAPEAALDEQVPSFFNDTGDGDAEDEPIF
ncbi:MAG: penicillin-binding protein 1A [Pseudomonadota bacterium]